MRCFAHLTMRAIRSGFGRCRLFDWGRFLKPYNSDEHSAYQECILAQLRKYYPDASSSLLASTWEIMKKFWNLDFSDMDALMADRYSDFGSAPSCFPWSSRSLPIPNGPLTSKRTISMPFFPAFLLDTLRTSIFFMISTDAFGCPIKITFPTQSTRQKKNPKSQREKAPAVEKVTVKELFAQFELHPPRLSENSLTFVHFAQFFYDISAFSKVLQLFLHSFFVQFDSRFLVFGQSAPLRASQTMALSIVRLSFNGRPCLIVFSFGNRSFICSHSSSVNS